MYDPWFSYKIRYDDAIMTSYARFIGEEKFKPYPDVYKKSYFARKYIKNTFNKQIARNYKRIPTIRDGLQILLDLIADICPPLF